MVEQRMIKTSASIAVMAMAVALSGCGSREQRSKQYFTTHLDEAQEVVAACQDGAVRGDECADADAALTEAKATKALSRFLGN